MNIRYQKILILLPGLLTASSLSNATSSRNNGLSVLDSWAISEERKGNSTFTRCFKVGQVLRLATDRGMFSLICESKGDYPLQLDVAHRRVDNYSIAQEQVWTLNLNNEPIIDMSYKYQTKIRVCTKTFRNMNFNHQQNVILDIMNLNCANLKPYAEDLINLFQTNFPHFLLSIQVENEQETISKFEEIGFLDMRKEIKNVSQLTQRTEFKPSIFSMHELKLEGMPKYAFADAESQAANEVKSPSITVMRRTSFLSLKDTQKDMLDTYLKNLFRLFVNREERGLISDKKNNEQSIVIFKKSIEEKNFFKNSLYYFVSAMKNTNKCFNVLFHDESKDLTCFCVYKGFNHFALHSLATLGYEGNLEKGYKYSLTVNGIESNGKKWPDLLVSFWTKGSWCLDSFCDAPIKMPDLILDVRNTIPQNTFISATSYAPRSSDIDNAPFRYVISDKGIQSGDYLFIKKEGSKITLERLVGENAAIPFSSENTMVIDAEGLEGDDGEKVIPLPEDEIDLEMIQYLLAAKIKEEDLEKTQLTEAEEVKDVEEEKNPDPLKLEKQKQEIEKQKRLEYLQREAEYRETMIKKIEAEIEKKELYDVQVKREQEESTKAVIDGTAGSKKARKTSSPQKAPLAESDMQKNARIHNLAIVEFETRRVKMNEVANCLNIFIKKNPQVRSLLSRQKGSHLVFNGISPKAGPATLVMPHGGDGTISRFSANTFFENFAKLVQFAASTQQSSHP